MRTTLTLEDDLAAKLKELPSRRKVSFNELVNDVLRRGMSAQGKADRAVKPFRVVPFSSSFMPGVDPMKLNQRGDEMEVEHNSLQG